ncbi:unnamed protein product, partial [Allacma fusca]
MMSWCKKTRTYLDSALRHSCFT